MNVGEFVQGAAFMGYVLHFLGTKQAKSRTSKVEKSIPQILDEKGLSVRRLDLLRGT